MVQVMMSSWVSGRISWAGGLGDMDGLAVLTCN